MGVIGGDESTGIVRVRRLTNAVVPSAGAVRANLPFVSVAIPNVARWLVTANRVEADDERLLGQERIALSRSAISDRGRRRVRASRKPIPSASEMRDEPP